MSCSQFVETEDEDKSDTLVIIVNGDGTVNVDPLTFERVLSQQRRAAVSVIRFENTNEPDSQTENEKTVDEKDKYCRKVNLVVEGYYPPPPLIHDKTNTTTESVVSSTVGTPPLRQTPSEFLDLLSEGLDIPVSQSPTPSNMHTNTGEGCIGDSLVDAFSEMAPEQLKQVETALHSEKAKQILGDDVTSVLDTLKLNEEPDDWVHFDHCYTSIYGNKKQSQSERVQNMRVQDSDVATMLTIKVGTKEDDKLGAAKKDTNSLSSENSSFESLELTMPENVEIMNETVDITATKRKISVQNRPKLITGSKVITLKGNQNDIRDLMNREKRSPAQLNQKVKRKNVAKNEQNESVPERIVKEDEVDGIKVFKPTRNDKTVKPFVFNKESDGIVPKTQLIQSRLNFSKKTEIPIEKSMSIGEMVKTNVESNEEKNLKKEGRKPVTPLTPELFGPALFSTPDIIRKINSEDESKSGTLMTDEQTADIEKRMSALENGEAILDQLHLQVEMEKEMEKITSMSDDDKLLSDLENSADEMETNTVTSTPVPTYKPTSKNLADLDDSDVEYSPTKSNNCNTSEDSEKNENEYEDDPNKLWCLCNKPHSNRFMICCDACDNWFHGSCVGISKSMGEKMEQNGTEWLCPSCKKEKCAKEREVKLKLATRSTAARIASRQSGNDSNSSVSSNNTSTNNDNHSAVTSNEPLSSGRRKSSSSHSEKNEKPSICAECKEKEAMSGAAYCSQECIIGHVTTSLATINSEQRIPLSEDKKIIVIDKKTGHMITGMRAPSVCNLKEWLLQHPSYEIVRPSALPISRHYPTTFTKPVQKSKPSVAKKEAIIRNRAQLIKAKLTEDGMIRVAKENSGQISMKQFLVKRPSVDDSAKDAVKMKVKKEDGISNIIIKDENKITPVKRDDPKLKDKQRQIKLIPVQPLSKPIEDQKLSPTVAKKVVPPPTPPVPDKKKKIIPPPTKTKVIVKKPEVKRPEVKKEVSVTEAAPAVPTPRPENVRANIRKSLHELFISKMKDVADITLSEEEVGTLALQVEEELFNVGKDVAKYKKGYRRLFFNIKDQKNNLFKRIVEKSLSPYDLVRLTPEELASTELAMWRQREAKHEIEMIKKTELENLNQAKVLVVKTHKGELEIESESLPPSKADVIVPDLQLDDIPEGKEKSGKKLLPYYLNKDQNSSKDKSKDDDRSGHEKSYDRHKKHDHKDKHKSRKHRKRSSEREKHQSRSRRSRSGHRSKSPEKEKIRGSSDEKTHRSRSTERHKESGRSRSKKRRSRSRSRRSKERSPERKDKIETKEEKQPKKEDSPKVEPQEQKPIDYLNPFNGVDVDLSDMEPTSTVTIKTPPHANSPEVPAHIWKGTLIMPDVAKFQTCLKEVSGNCEGLDEDLQGVIDCVGRINPSTVWDYISKVKKTGSKEILVLRFEISEPEERISYLSLYTYLNTKNRMAVVGNTGPAIKDFYVLPLASHNPVPQVLLPLDGPGFEDYRAHMLLAVIVRSRRKKYLTSSIISQPLVSALPKKEHEQYVPGVLTSFVSTKSEDSFTPPHSPTSVFISTQIPITTSAAKSDDDEPYSPKDDEPYSPGALEEEQSKSMESFRESESSRLNDKNESANSTSHDGDIPELYSPSEHFFNDIESSEVQLPGTLQNLIKSLKKTSEPPNINFEKDPIVDAYKKSGDRSDDEDDNNLESVFSLPPPIALDDENEDDDDDDEEQQQQSERESTPVPEKELETSSETVSESVEETKANRDPRRKAAAVSDAFRSSAPNQPPPPGMEEEFGVPVTTSGSATDTITTTLPETGYSTQMPAYAFTATQAMPAFPALIPPQMYMAPAVYSQTPFMTPQMYVPPPLMHTDPSFIPLPMESPEVKKSEKRKADDDKEDDDDKDKSKKHKNYYGSDSKTGDSRTSPNKHRGSSYDSHHRGYQRDDVEYNSRETRYGHKYGRSYRDRGDRSDRGDRGDRGGYWKGGSDYSSNYKKYSSHSSDRERDKNSSRHNRWDNSKHREEDWDSERHYESKREKSDSKHS